MHILPLSATEIENRLKSLPENAVVHEYSPDSEYPLSGKAVAEALASLYTHYAGTLIDKTNYSGVDYLDQIFKKDDIYINDSENNIYQCVSSELNEDGSYHSVWRIIIEVDQVYDSNSENAQSGKAVAEAITNAIDKTLTVEGKAADANAVGEKLSKISTDLNIVKDDLYELQMSRQDIICIKTWEADD